MQIIGDKNATLLDLTDVAEAAIMEPKNPLYPLISTVIESADEAYIKIPIQTKVAIPTVFDGERQVTSTDVTVVQEYDKVTYGLTMDFNSDLMRESKAYTLASKVQEATTRAVIFPNYNLAKNVIIANSLAYDGIALYATNHKWAKSGSNNINNTVAKTGQTPTALYADLQTAMAAMGTFLDDKGQLLNPDMEWGADKIVIHCPMALAIAFRQVIFGSLLPITVPVTTSGTAAATATGPNGLGLGGIATLKADGNLDVSSTTTWYIHYIGYPQKPFVFGESYGLQGRALGPGSEFETNTNKVRIALKHRFVSGVYRFDRTVRVA